MIPVNIIEILDDALIPPGRGHRIFTSLEGELPGGSIKDRMVAGEMARWAAAGELRPGRILTEASAGSTAKSLAHYAHEAGCRCVIFALDSLPRQHLQLLRVDLEKQGAELRVVPLSDILDRIHAFSKENHALYLNQMAADGKRGHYTGFGRVIAEKLGSIDALIGAVGTGHSLLGTAAGLPPSTSIISAEPSEGEVPGVRNVAQTRFGDGDPVAPGDFTRRILVPAPPSSNQVIFESSAGPVQGGGSFALVLSAAAEYLRNTENKQVFLIGAANYRKSFR